MKVIFLDIDGVLNSYKYLKSRSTDLEVDMFDPIAVGWLNKLVKRTNANIVISSSWRIGHTLIQIQSLLTANGFEYSEKVIGSTVWTMTGERGEEIQTWLDQVPVDGFVILDDIANMGPLVKKMVQTEPEVGLTNKDINLAERILNEK